MTKADFARKISGMVFMTELCASRMLGCSEIEALDSAFDAHDEAYFSVFAPDREAVLPRFRPMLSDPELIGNIRN